MEQTDDIFLKELRFWEPDSFEKKNARRLRVMLDRLSRALLNSLTYPIKLKNTNVILYSVINSDNRKQDDNIGNIYSLGRSNEYIGGSVILISERRLMSINDSEKRAYLMETIFQSLQNFLTHAGYGLSADLSNAYETIKKRDYSRKASKEYKLSDNQNVCWIESKESFGSADYCLVVKQNKTSQIRIFHIARKDHVFFDEIPGITQKEILDYPQYFNPIKLEGKNFVMYWGKEKYIFDPATEKITLE
jgi:hypothetical protein